MKKNTKKMLFAIIILFILLILVSYFKTGSLSFKFFKDEDNYASENIYLADVNLDNVIYEKNATSKIYPASLTKIMTTLVALEHIEDLSAMAPIDVATYQEMVKENASMAGFFGNEQVSYRDLLYGTILRSGGEAANSLAINVVGDVDTFVDMMNAKAKSLNLNGTHFTNPEGLQDKNQYTTAKDIATLLAYALQNKDFYAIFTKQSFTTTATPDHPDGLQLKSTVLSQIPDKTPDGIDIIGGKSGTTPEAGQCWATLAKIGDREYICIVMGAPLDDLNHPDHAQIADTLNLFSLIAN